MSQNQYMRSSLTRRRRTLKDRASYRLCRIKGTPPEKFGDYVRENIPYIQNLEEREEMLRSPELIIAPFDFDQLHELNSSMIHTAGIDSSITWYKTIPLFLIDIVQEREQLTESEIDIFFSLMAEMANNESQLIRVKTEPPEYLD